jgi:hypothetical protein
MEYCDGRSCNDLMHVLKRGFDELHIASIMHQVLIGVTYLHSMTPAIIHRDIKVPNISPTYINHTTNISLSSSSFSHAKLIARDECLHNVLYRWTFPEFSSVVREYSFKFQRRSQIGRFWGCDTVIWHHRKATNANWITVRALCWHPLFALSPPLLPPSYFWHPHFYLAWNRHSTFVGREFYWKIWWNFLQKFRLKLELLWFYISSKRTVFLWSAISRYWSSSHFLQVLDGSWNNRHSGGRHTIWHQGRTFIFPSEATCRWTYGASESRASSWQRQNLPTMTRGPSELSMPYALSLHRRWQILLGGLRTSLTLWHNV